MLTRQRQLGGQIAPGITLFPVFLVRVLSLRPIASRQRDEKQKDAK